MGENNPNDSGFLIRNNTGQKEVAHFQELKEKNLEFYIQCMDPSGMKGAGWGGAGHREKHCNQKWRDRQINT